MLETKCTLNELFIEQFVDGELDFKESAEISAHLEICQECKRKYNEIKFVKITISGIKTQEVLSVIEREGFNSLINHFNSKTSLLQIIARLIKSHGFAVGTSFVSFASLLIVFSFFIYKSDEQNRLITNELISAHNYTFPDEFSGSEKTETELKKNFKYDKNLLKKLARISPEVRGRFTSIAANPVAKIILRGLANEKGTLFMSKKNEHLKKLFDDKKCLVENDKDNCKARAFQEKNNDLVYWENEDNDYVFVTDNSKMLAQMVQLISSE